MSEGGLRAAGFPWRLYCGPRVLEQNLKEAVMRAGAKRAFVICSPSITRRTDTVARIATALGDLHAGVFDAVENDATYTSVRAATEAALTAAGADLLIAAGGGSVIMAARGVAIFMAEAGDPLRDHDAVSGKPARLQSAPDGCQTADHQRAHDAEQRNEPAGTALKNPDLDHRMEYFDPKTRPHSIFLDHEALLATPAQ